MTSRSLFAATTLLTAAGLSAQVPLIGFWTFDETSGLVASDIGPFANAGTLVGYGANGTWVAGQFGNALQFDGVDDYVDIATNGGVPIYRGDGSPFSVCFWVKALPTDDDRVYSEGESAAGTNGGSLFTLGTGRNSLSNTDKLQLYIRNDQPTEIAKIYSTSTVFDDTWHHVAYVDVAGDARLYVDGVLDATPFDYRISGGGSPNSGTQTANYGTFSMNRVSVGAVLRANVVAHMSGNVDDLRIFAFALSAADVQTVMANGFPSTCRASIGEFGIGCGSGPFDLAATGSALIGGPGIQMQMQNGSPNSPAFLCFGFGRITPVDLTSIGFAGCTAYPANMICVGSGALGATGSAPPTTISVPNDPNLACRQVNFQAAALDATVPTMLFSDVVQAYLGY